MLLSKRLWAVLLAGVLVAGLLVGFGDGDRAVAKEPRATLGKVMVPAAAFIPTSDDWDYTNLGYRLMASGVSTFAAPLSFPVPEVYIRKIMLIAFDNGAGDACATLYRAEPLRASESNAGQVCTANRADDPQKVALTAINPRRFNTPNHGPYLSVYIDSGIIFYGVQVVYSY